jgi:hypothetical protein
MRELCHNEGNEKAVTDPFYLEKEQMVIRRLLLLPGL